MFKSYNLSVDHIHDIEAKDESENVACLQCLLRAVFKNICSEWKDVKISRVDDSRDKEFNHDINHHKVVRTWWIKWKCDEDHSSALIDIIVGIVSWNLLEELVDLLLELTPSLV